MKKYSFIIILSFLLILLILSFWRKFKKEDVIIFGYTMNDPRMMDSTLWGMDLETAFDTLQNRVVYNGDTKAYNTLATAYFYREYPEEILFYSFLMAHKYDFNQAYYDVYHNLTITYYCREWQIDDGTAELAMSYLFKAAEKGHKQAKEETQKIIDHDIKGSKEQIRFLGCN